MGNSLSDAMGYRIEEVKTGTKLEANPKWSSQWERVVLPGCGKLLAPRKADPRFHLETEYKTDYFLISAALDRWPRLLPPGWAKPEGDLSERQRVVRRRQIMDAFYAKKPSKAWLRANVAYLASQSSSTRYLIEKWTTTFFEFVNGSAFCSDGYLDRKTAELLVETLEEIAVDEGWSVKELHLGEEELGLDEGGEKDGEEKEDKKSSSRRPPREVKSHLKFSFERIRRLLGLLRLFISLVPKGNARHESYEFLWSEAEDNFDFGKTKERFTKLKGEIGKAINGDAPSLRRQLKARFVKVMHGAPPLDRDIIVYRGIIGAPKKDTNLRSFSIDWAMARSFAQPGQGNVLGYLYRLTIPKGGKMLFVPTLSSYAYAHEMEAIVDMTKINQRSWTKKWHIFMPPSYERCSAKDTKKLSFSNVIVFQGATLDK